MLRSYVVEKICTDLLTVIYFGLPAWFKQRYFIPTTHLMQIRNNEIINCNPKPTLTGIKSLRLSDIEINKFELRNNNTNIPRIK